MLTDRLTSMVRSAFEERKAERGQHGVNAFRFWPLLDESPPEGKGFTLDAFSTVWVCTVQAGAETPVALLRELGVCTSVKRAGGPGFSARAEATVGQVPECVEVSEGSVKLLCRPLEDGTGGLFLDLQDGRLRFAAELRQNPTERVLNLFAYTGSFSVHAARAGVKQVTTVDASRRALAWARENFEANGLSPRHHRWFSDDALTHLRRQASGSFDWVVADPPAFGRAKKRRFVLQRDVMKLWTEAFRVASRGVLFCTHDPEWSESELHPSMREVAKSIGKSPEICVFGPSPGFEGPLKECWVRFV